MKPSHQYVCPLWQLVSAITGVSEYNKELVQKYQREMKLRKKYHNELVELKGMFLQSLFYGFKPSLYT